VILARKADGTPLPFGAAVMNEAGKELGLVGQGSKVFVRGLKDHGELVVKWGNDSRSVCRIAYDLPVKASHRKATSYQQITGTCRPGTL
jgi:outer membrane usher protein